MDSVEKDYIAQLNIELERENKVHDQKIKNLKDYIQSAKAAELEYKTARLDAEEQVYRKQKNLLEEYAKLRAEANKTAAEKEIEYLSAVQDARNNIIRAANKASDGLADAKAKAEAAIEFKYKQINEKKLADLKARKQKELENVTDKNERKRIDKKYRDETKALKDQEKKEKEKAKKDAQSKYSTDLIKSKFDKNALMKGFLTGK